MRALWQSTGSLTTGETSFFAGLMPCALYGAWLGTLLCCMAVCSDLHSCADMTPSCTGACRVDQIALKLPRKTKEAVKHRIHLLEVWCKALCLCQMATLHVCQPTSKVSTCSVCPAVS